MERNPESAWGTSSPESGVDSSSSGSSKESKGKKGSDAARAEQPDRQAAQGFARLFGREALQRPAEKEVVIQLRAEAARDEPKGKVEQTTQPTDDQHEGSPENKQEREVAAEVVGEAQARNEKEALQADNGVGRIATENVGQLLENMEAGLESAPAEETAEHIIDRTTDETASSLVGEQSASNEMQPLDWPEFATDTQNAPLTEVEDGGPSATYAEASSGGPWQQEQIDRLIHDDESEQTDTAAPYGAAVGGQGMGGERPPLGSAAGFNPNAMPPLGGAVPAAANLTGWRARAHETRDALLRGFLLGAFTGGIFGHWLGKRGERARAERAMNKQERAHQERVAKYESQVAESQARIRSLTERQAYAARQVVRATEAAPVMLGVAERPSTPTKQETRPAEMRTGAPKRVEMMTDAEVHEASRNLRIGDKTLYELKENGTIDATEERTLLRLAEQGGIEDPVRKYHFDQEARRVLMRHELDPRLAQQVLQQEREERAGDQYHDEQGSDPMTSLPLGQYIPLSESAARVPRSTADIEPSSSRQSTDRVSTSHPLVVANIIAVGILIGLLVVLLVISVTR